MRLRYPCYTPTCAEGGKTKKNVKFAAAAIGTLVALSLPVIIIVWYVMGHRLPGIGPFEAGSTGNSFLWMLILVSIYGAIISIPITIIKRKKRD